MLSCFLTFNIIFDADICTRVEFIRSCSPSLLFPFIISPLLKTTRNNIVATKQFFKNNNHFESIIDERIDLSSMKFQIYYLNSRIKNEYF